MRTRTRTSRISRADRTAGWWPYHSRRRSASAVDGRYLIGVPLEHQVPLDLQGGRDLAGLLGPVPAEDPELPDGLGPGDREVGVVDRLLDLLAEVPILAQLRHGRLGRLGVPGQPLRPHLLVDGDQRADERLAVADDDALADQRMSAHPILQHG